MQNKIKMKNNKNIGYPKGYYEMGKIPKDKDCKGDDFKTAVSNTGKVEANFTDPFVCLSKSKGNKK